MKFTIPFFSVITELVAGFMMPGNPTAVMMYVSRTSYHPHWHRWLISSSNFRRFKVITPRYSCVRLLNFIQTYGYITMSQGTLPPHHTSVTCAQKLLQHCNSLLTSNLGSKSKAVHWRVRVWHCLDVVIWRYYPPPLFLTDTDVHPTGTSTTNVLVSSRSTLLMEIKLLIDVRDRL